jgi:hypothetical protein
MLWECGSNGRMPGKHKVLSSNPSTEKKKILSTILRYVSTTVTLLCYKALGDIVSRIEYFFKVLAAKTQRHHVISYLNTKLKI